MTPEEIATLPDDLLSAAGWTDSANARLLRSAAERICALEEQAVRDAKAVNDLTELIKELRWAIVRHRGRRDFMGGKEQCDRDLWAVVADVPWGDPVKGDG